MRARKAATADRADYRTRQPNHLMRIVAVLALAGAQLVTASPASAQPTPVEVFSPSPIAPQGTLGGGSLAQFQVTIRDSATNLPLPNWPVQLSFTGQGSALVGGVVPLATVPQLFLSDTTGTIPLLYRAPSFPPTSGVDVVILFDSLTSFTSTDTYQFASVTPPPPPAPEICTYTVTLQSVGITAIDSFGGTPTGPTEVKTWGFAGPSQIDDKTSVALTKVQTKTIKRVIASGSFTEGADPRFNFAFGVTVPTDVGLARVDREQEEQRFQLHHRTHVFGELECPMHKVFVENLNLFVPARHIEVMEVTLTYIIDVKEDVPEDE